MIKSLYIFRGYQIMNRDSCQKLLKKYGICGFTPQPASSNLRNIAKSISARQSNRACIGDLTEYLLLNGIPVGDRRP